MNSILAVAVMAVSTVAFAESHVVYRPQPNAIFFGDDGFIPSKDVCLNAAGMLQATIAEKTVEICDQSYIDRSSSINPRTVCTASHFETTPAKTVEAPTQFAANVCAQPTYERNEHGYYVPACAAVARGTVTQDLDYTVEVYSSWDYRRESPMIERKTIASCAR